MKNINTTLLGTSNETKLKKKNSSKLSFGGSKRTDAYTKKLQNKNNIEKEVNMTRLKLKQIGTEERKRYVGTVEKFGIKNGYRGRGIDTILLINIKLEGSEEIITDHLWFDLGKQFSDLNLQKGDIIAFNARVAKYKKGYYGGRELEIPKPPAGDYKLQRPTKVTVVKRADNSDESLIKTK